MVQSIMEFVSRQWGLAGKSKAAFVVAHDLDFGMSRMYQALMEGATASKIAVFRDMD